MFPVCTGYRQSSCHSQLGQFVLHEQLMIAADDVRSSLMKQHNTDSMYYCFLI